MNTVKGTITKGKIFKRILIAFLVLLVSGALFLYYSYNRMIADALMKSFNENIASDVYELKFRNLNVNFFSGSIRVNDVDLRPREKPLGIYPYINSSIHLSTKKVLLGNVEIFTLLRQHKLRLKKIEIREPSLEFAIADEIPIFVPFSEAPADSAKMQQKGQKRILAVSLDEFDLTDATWKVANSARGRDLSVTGVNLSIRNLQSNQEPGKGLFGLSLLRFSVKEISGTLQKDKLRRVHLKDYYLNMDSLVIEKTADKMNYQFRDLNLGLKDLDLVTLDSVLHLSAGAVDLSYKDKSLIVNKLKFEPLISEQAMQDKYQFQHTQFSGSIGSLRLTELQYDSLMYGKKLLVGEISLDSVDAAIFKDNTKPRDLKKFPKYLGQSIKGIKMPLRIDSVNASNVSLVNRERKPDMSYARANIGRGTVKGANVTNIDTTKAFTLSLSAYLENKVPFSLSLEFDYLEPKFNLEGSFGKFDLVDLNPLISSYTPAKINSGMADEIHFKGVVLEKSATGTMKFLYHDLNMDLELKDKAKWKSSVLAFAANTAVASSNPPYEDQPPKIVGYKVDRDMNKSFINITIKSALAGLKETVMMSKENRKNYKEQKRRARKE